MFVLQIGPGLVNLTLKSRFGMVLLIHSLTPQEPFLQKYCLQAFSDWWIPTFVIKMLVQGYDVQVSTTDTFISDYLLFVTSNLTLTGLCYFLISRLCFTW